MDWNSHQINVSAGTPKGICSAILDGVASTIRSVLGGYLETTRGNEKSFETYLHLRTEASTPSVCQFTVEIANLEKSTYWVFTISSRAPDNVRVDETYRAIAIILAENKATVISKSYSSGMLCGNDSLYLH